MSQISHTFGVNISSRFPLFVFTTLLACFFLICKLCFPGIRFPNLITCDGKDLRDSSLLRHWLVCFYSCGPLSTGSVPGSLRHFPGRRKLMLFSSRRARTSLRGQSRGYGGDKHLLQVNDSVQTAWQTSSRVASLHDGRPLTGLNRRKHWSSVQGLYLEK